jgi:hypothetical protein
MLVFVAVAFHQSPDWGDVAHGFLPSLSSSTLYRRLAHQAFLRGTLAGLAKAGPAPARRQR